MCGIVGYVGNKTAEERLINGLEKLEYRGYDSAGICVSYKGDLRVVKSQGRVDTLAQKTKALKVKGDCGIGHARWATHGAPVFKNAHPHLSADGCFALVHNGIIENGEELKEMLKEKGVSFQSDTDTEVIPQLMQEFYDGDVQNTLKRVLHMLQGSYGLVMVSSYAPDVIFAAAKDSPIVLGIGHGECYVASDIQALGTGITKGYFLEEGEFATVAAGNIQLWDKNGNELKKEITLLENYEDAADKEGFEYFMLKEITEQPKAIRETFLSCLGQDGGLFPYIPTDFFDDVTKVHIVGCGSAYHAGLLCAHFVEKLAKTETKTALASEFRYGEPVMYKEDLAIFISQSGETADTLAALRYAKKIGVKTLAIVNRKNSSLAREADCVIVTRAGAEIAVATTKAYSTQVVVSYLLALQLGVKNGFLSDKKCKEFLHALSEFPQKVEKILSDTEELQSLAQKLCQEKNLFFMGRGMDYAAAQEGSLKLKEISYIHSEAYAAGELKHGTISLIEEGIPVVAVVTQKNILEKMKSNIREVKARGAFVVAVATEGFMERKDADVLVSIPPCTEHLSALLSVIPLQLLSYFITVQKGLDVDKPRNLAKSVTVE